MKKYLLFAGRSYYPGGGADDFLAKVEINEAFDIADQVDEHLEDFGAFDTMTLDGDWFHMADPETPDIIWQGVWRDAEGRWEITRKPTPDASPDGPASHP